MKAFVLAGGLGTRLRPTVGDLPKALVPLGGRPFLLHQLEWLAGHGVGDVVVCSGHGADRLQQAVGTSPLPGVRVAYSVEDSPLGTGGALRHAARHVDGPALVLNGDTLLACDPWALERARWESGAVAAVALFERASAEATGRVERDQEGWVVRFVEKDAAHKGPALVNGGLYACAPELWALLPEGPSSLERDALPALAAQRKLKGVVAAGDFLDIGTPEGLARGEARHPV